MATFKICVFEHQKRSTDGKYPVSIRVCWKRKYAYIKTEYYVTEKQLEKKTYKLKDTYIINDLNLRILSYEDIKAKKLGRRIELYSVKELAEYFVKESKQGTDSSINFIQFSREHIEKLRKQGRVSTSNAMRRTVNMLVDFANGRETIAVTEITTKFLHKFEDYLRGERTIKRKNQFGKLVKVKHEGISDISIIDYMTDIRTLFNAAMNEFNDEDKNEIRIAHYPFRRYKMIPKPENKKRNVSVDQIKLIRDVDPEKLIFERAIFARDIFMLSFYLVGINLIDLYEIDTYQEGRLSYERTKTKGRRSDRAFISIRVEPEAEIMIRKYADPSGERVFDFYKRYSTSHVFSSNVNKGLKYVAQATEIKEALSSYYARHSWATIARNDCDVSKDDIDLALNHVDQKMKVTDMYIRKDWSRIDSANRKVIDFTLK